MKSVLVKGTRLFYRFALRPQFPDWPWCTLEEREYTNQVMYNLLTKDSPCFVGRIGTVEQACVLNYLQINSHRSIYQRLKNYVTDNTRLPWWEDIVLKRMGVNAGFFPDGRLDLINKFCELYLRDIPLMDVNGRFHYWDNFMPFQKDIVNVQFETLYPFFVKTPWTKALKGKRVLVVHPFTSTIEHQYEKRKHLFESEDTLPEFELKTVRAVQSIAGMQVPFKDWFEAFEYMKSEIKKNEFDVCILGCGAYGLPLAAYVKRMGKKAVHLGGGTQLLFGIKGKRWEVDYKDSCYRDMFNEHWIYPSQNEKPVGAEKVEGACYW